MTDSRELNHSGRLYVIGDIHGRLDLLDQLIAAIRRDLETHDGASLTVTLGDYVDRGPNSRGVIDRLLANPFPGDYVALKGNPTAENTGGNLVDSKRYPPLTFRLRCLCATTITRRRRINCVPLCHRNT
jgi:Calcineurin-like phosphoesterase